MLGHLFFHNEDLLSPDPSNDWSNELDAGVCDPSSASSPASLLSSLTSNGVSSVVRLDGCERRDRDDRRDFWEAGRELGVCVDVQGPSGVSMVGNATVF